MKSCCLTWTLFSNNSCRLDCSLCFWLRYYVGQETKVAISLLLWSAFKMPKWLCYSILWFWVTIDSISSQSPEMGSLPPSLYLRLHGWDPKTFFSCNVGVTVWKGLRTADLYLTFPTFCQSLLSFPQYTAVCLPLGLLSLKYFLGSFPPLFCIGSIWLKINCVIVLCRTLEISV